MLLLVLDTSTPAVTAALVDVRQNRQPEVIAGQVTVDARRHAELLTPAVAAVLAQAALEPRQISAVVAGLGPGPYTGLRIGLVTAEAFADALAVPSYGVCSLDGIGYPMPSDQRLLVATDARRREVYWASYDASGARLSGPDVSRPADVDTSECDVACGAGARLYAQVLGLRVDGPDYPQALRLAALAAARALGGAPSERLEPLYLRRPDAARPASPKAVRQ